MNRQIQPPLINGHNIKPTTEEKDYIVAHWPKELRNMFVISIRPTRLENFEKRLGKLCKYLTVVDGVDGNLLNMNRILEQKVYKPINKWNVLTRGEIGCFMSHREVWKHIVQENIPYALIMEDDCLLYPSVAVLDRLHSCITELRKGDPNWSILFLARNPEVAEIIKPAK